LKELIPADDLPGSFISLYRESWLKLRSHSAFSLCLLLALIGHLKVQCAQHTVTLALRSSAAHTVATHDCLAV
jgi:hypothetical protein